MSATKKTPAVVHDDVVVVDRNTSKLEAFRLVDTVRAPAIIVFIDQEPPQLLPIRQGQQPPSRIRSLNMENEIQIISYEEINSHLMQHS